MEEVDELVHWTIDQIVLKIEEGNTKITPDSIICFGELMKSDEALAIMYDPEYKPEEIKESEEIKE